MKESKKAIIEHILMLEGGYINDSSDSGGATRYGITEKVARENGYAGDMRDITKEFAIKIYEDKYCNRLFIDDILSISYSIAFELTDTAVNMGVSRAVKFLQRSLNVLNNKASIYNDVVCDGIMGDNTINALKQYIDKRGAKGIEILHNMLNCLQGAFYVTLAETRQKDEKFIYGWFANRIILRKDEIS